MKKYDENTSRNPNIFASAVGLSAFGTLFYIPNRLKLVNSIPAISSNIDVSS